MGNLAIDVRNINVESANKSTTIIYSIYILQSYSQQFSRNNFLLLMCESTYIDLTYSKPTTRFRRPFGNYKTVA